MRFYGAQEGHIVNVLPPINSSGGKTGKRFSMKNWDHATVIVKIGVSAAAPTAIIVKECTAASAGTAVAIIFDYFRCETAYSAANGDVLGARATATTAGITSIPTTDNIFYVIELDSRQLTDGYPWVEVSITNATANSVIADIVAVLSGGRFAGDQNPTVLA